MAAFSSSVYIVGLLLRLMSDSECLLSWEAVEGKIITYEAQYRKTGSQDFKQVRVCVCEERVPQGYVFKHSTFAH